MRNSSGRGKAIPTPSVNATRVPSPAQTQQTAQGRFQKPTSAVRPPPGQQKRLPPPASAKSRLPAVNPHPQGGAQQNRAAPPASTQSKVALASTATRQPITQIQLLKQQSSTVTSKAKVTAGPPSRLGGPPVIKVDTMPCRHCGRPFVADRLQKHEEICSKVSKKKRKQYDAVKHRVMGTEAESFVKSVGRGRGAGVSGGKALTKQPSAMKNNWRKKHEDFIATIRSAKQMQAHVKAGGNLKDLPPPPPSDYSDYVKCPHCGRSFNKQAAERHISKCASYNFNKPKGPPQQPAKRK